MESWINQTLKTNLEVQYFILLSHFSFQIFQSLRKFLKIKKFAYVYMSVYNFPHISIIHIYIWKTHKGCSMAPTTYGHASAGWRARTYQQQLCTDTGCSLEDLPGSIDNDRDGCRVRESGISMLESRFDDDDDIYIYVSVCYGLHACLYTVYVGGLKSTLADKVTHTLNILKSGLFFNIVSTVIHTHLQSLF